MVGTQVLGFTSTPHRPAFKNQTPPGLFYIKNWNLKTDFKIWDIKVLKREGASIRKGRKVCKKYKSGDALRGRCCAGRAGNCVTSVLRGSGGFAGAGLITLIIESSSG